MKKDRVQTLQCPLLCSSSPVATKVLSTSKQNIKTETGQNRVAVNSFGNTLYPSQKCLGGQKQA